MYKNKLVWGFSFWIIPFVFLFGQRYVSGCITDIENNEPISGVAVFISNTAVGTITDKSGNYMLKIPGEGNYNLTVSHVGYQPVCRDIEYGNTSITLDISLNIKVIEEVKVSAKVRFRQRDIDLFWRTILGKQPSKKSIYAINPEAAYYYYNAETRILKVSCHEPLHIINNEMGYHIQLLLDHFTYDYTTLTVSWNYDLMFIELTPEQDRQKTVWAEKRKKVYQISRTNFIKALYHNTLLENGFLLTHQNKSELPDNLHHTPYETPILTFSPVDSIERDKTFHVPSDLKDLMLVCFGKPIKQVDMNIVDKAQDGRINWMNVGIFRNKIFTPEGPIQIFSDGTYSNTLQLDPCYSSSSLAGLDMILPLEYVPDADKPIHSMYDDYEFIEDDLFKRLEQQLKVLPQEKLYLQTDKSHYLSGETIWFSATIVEAVFHEPVTDENYLYVELRNSLDTIMSRVIIKPDSLNGFYGHIPLDKDLTEGNYYLLAYRNTMTNPDYFFKRVVYVSDPASAVIAPECKFTENEREYLTEISFRNPQNKEKLLPDNLSIQVNGGKLNILAFQEDSVCRFSFKKSDVTSPVLTLHIEYQSKHYKKYVPLTVAGSDYDVSFFPEGGQLINGVPSVLAFKAIKRNGLSESVTGHIEDGEGNIVANFESMHKGMGKVLLLPEQGKTYYAVCKNDEQIEKRFKLPEAQKDNFALQVERQQKWVSISVTGLSQASNDPQLSLFIHSKGLPLYHNKWNPERNLLLIAQDSFPSGISHLLLLNSNNDIISERLIFNRNRQDEAVTDFVTNAEIYDKRTLVTSKISLYSNQGALTKGKFAVSVTDDKFVTLDSTSNILSALLLSSELKGHIEDPAGYFRGDDRESADALDLLMMTQGWRRYNIPEIIKGKIDIPKTASIDEKVITGKAERSFRALKDATISLIVNTPTGNSELKVTTTDKNGRFIFDNLSYPDSTYIIVQSSDKKGNENIFLTVDQPSILKYKVTFPSIFSSENDTDYHEYTAISVQQYTNEHGMRMKELPEITVTAKRPIARSVFYSPINDYVEIKTSEDIEKIDRGNLANYLLTLPEVVRIIRVPRDQVYVKVQGQVSLAKFIINDYVINDFDLDMIGLNMIEELFILKKYYEHFQEKPAIVITLKKEGWGGKSQPPQNIRKIEWLGYQRPVEFYSPKYETIDEKNAEKPDLRTTLYWNPSIQTDENGEASFDFYTADESTTYSVIIEGITNDGKIIRHVSSINRN